MEKFDRSNIDHLRRCDNIDWNYDLDEVTKSELAAHKGFCARYPEWTIIDNDFCMRVLDAFGIAGLNYRLGIRLTEKDFPNFPFGGGVVQNAYVTGFGSGSKYTLCQSAPSGGSRCSGCGALNEFAGPNMGDKYVCYECR